ncbi:MAG: hypothetical protein F4W90_09435 [Gammaproteobacteria bacterium]|nr:hypothetical protein [Gammaproteobacteria bacterium]
MLKAFDTLAATEQLQNGGLDESQSKAVVCVIDGAFSESMFTKSEFEDRLEDLWLKFRFHLFLTQGALFLAFITVLKDWSQIFG